MSHHPCSTYQVCQLTIRITRMQRLRKPHITGSGTPEHFFAKQGTAMASEPRSNPLHPAPPPPCWPPRPPLVAAIQQQSVVDPNCPLLESSSEVAAYISFQCRRVCINSSMMQTRELCKTCVEAKHQHDSHSSHLHQGKKRQCTKLRVTGASVPTSSSGGVSLHTYHFTACSCVSNMHNPL